MVWVENHVVLEDEGLLVFCQGVIALIQRVEEISDVLLLIIRDVILREGALQDLFPHILHPIGVAVLRVFVVKALVALRNLWNLDPLALGRPLIRVLNRDKEH